MRLKFYFFLIVISILISLIYNIVNLELTKKYIKGPSVPIYGLTNYSPDNEYYLNPAENLISGDALRRDPAVGSGSYFRRVPGYSLLYYSFRQFFEKPGTHLALVIFQTLLFGLSTLCVYKISRMLTTSKPAFLITLLYTIIPWFSSYLFFTITEGISPYFMVFYLLFLFKARFSVSINNKLIYYLAASFFIGAALMTRPSNGIAALALPMFIIAEFRVVPFKQVFNLLLFSGLIPLCMIFSWAYRNYYHTGEIVLLEKGFHPESLDRQKPEWEGLLNFAKSWGEDGTAFNHYNLPLFNNAIKGNDDPALAKKAVDSWPNYVVTHFGYSRLYNMVRRYQLITVKQGIYYQMKIAMPKSYDPEQLKIKSDFDQLTNEFKQAFPLQYYVLSPLKYIKDLIVHSNTNNIFIFKKMFRDNILLNIVRNILAVLHVLIYVNMLLNIYLLRKEMLNLLVFCVIPIIYILFFAFYFKLIEQRYMLPLLPWLLIGTYKILGIIRDRYFNRTVSRGESKPTGFQAF
jgi:hypothetical protein